LVILLVMHQLRNLYIGAPRRGSGPDKKNSLEPQARADRQKSLHEIRKIDSQLLGDLGLV
jgi:hypothetical protein